MSGPIAAETLEAQTTKGLGGKEPNMLIMGRDYHPEVPANCFGRQRDGETDGTAVSHLLMRKKVADLLNHEAEIS